MARFPQRPVFTAERQISGAVLAPVRAASAGGLADEEVKALRESIERLNERIAAIMPIAGNSEVSELVRSEVQSIHDRIRLTKREIAAMRHPKVEEDKLASATVALSAVVRQTEEATSGIMAAAEQIDELATELKTHVGEGYANDRLSEIAEQVVAIFEACSFQDLTGQRITKVVRTIEFIEERVERLMNVWIGGGQDDEPEPEAATLDKVDDGLALHGPQDEGQGVSQADIDKMFE